MSLIVLGELCTLQARRTASESSASQRQRHLGNHPVLSPLARRHFPCARRGRSCRPHLRLPLPAVRLDTGARGRLTVAPRKLAGHWGKRSPSSPCKRAKLSRHARACASPGNRRRPCVCRVKCMPPCWLVLAASQRMFDRHVIRSSYVRHHSASTSLSPCLPK